MPCFRELVAGPHENRVADNPVIWKVDRPLSKRDISSCRSKHWMCVLEETSAA